MKHAYLLIGLPGSGKSTYAKKIVDDAVENGKSVGYFSLDSARLEFFQKHNRLEPEFVTPISLYSQSWEYARENNKAFDEFVQDHWNNIRTKYEIVIVDNTHMTRKSRARWVQGLRSSKNKDPFHITAVNIMVPVDVAVQRQASRPDKSVPEPVIRNMHMSYQEVLVPSEADKLVHIKGF